MEGIITKLNHSPFVDLPRIADDPKFLNKRILCDYMRTGQWFLNKEAPLTMHKGSDIPSGVPDYLLDANDCEKQLNTTYINTADLYANIDYYEKENKGPWKQGWDYEYDNRFKHLTIHVVPHSHNDPGWLKTYHDYYSTQTKHILDTVVATLIEDARRTFIWAEISYFSLWWKDASDQQKTQTRILIGNQQLEFVTGGWVMNDEASVTAPPSAPNSRRDVIGSRNV